METWVLFRCNTSVTILGIYTFPKNATRLCWKKLAWQEVIPWKTKDEDPPRKYSQRQGPQ